MGREVEIRRPLPTTRLPAERPSPGRAPLGSPPQGRGLPLLQRPLGVSTSPKGKRSNTFGEVICTNPHGQQVTQPWTSNNPAKSPLKGALPPGPLLSSQGTPVPWHGTSRL